MPKLRPVLLAFLLAAALAPLAEAKDTPKETIAALQAAVDKAPTDADAHFELAMAMARTVKVEAAISSLEKIKQIDASYPDKVIAKYEPLVAQNKQDNESYFRLAFGYYFKSWSLNEQAGSVSKTDPTAAGVFTAQATQAKAQARTAFEAILTNDPSYVWAYNYLAYLVYESGDATRSIDLLRQSISVEDNAAAHLLLGQALIRQGNAFMGAGEMARGMSMRGLNP